MEFIGYYYCDVILLKVITTASIKDQTNRVSAVFQARRVKGDISVTGTIRDSYFSIIYTRKGGGGDWESL